MKIQLKRSNVLDGGSAKKPTAAQMEYGELAVNYNAADPTIFIKDDSGTIIPIAGDSHILNLIQENQQIIIDNNPPTTPAPINGDLWLDMSKCPPELNVWTDCETAGGEWLPIGGGGADAIAFTPVITDDGSQLANTPTHVLTADAGTIVGGTAPIEYGFVWKSAGTEVGVTTKTYTLQNSDVGNVISCDVTVAEPDGTNAETRTATYAQAIVSGASINQPTILSPEDGAGLGDGTTTFTETSEITNVVETPGQDGEEWNLSSVFTNGSIGKISRYVRSIGSRTICFERQSNLHYYTDSNDLSDPWQLSSSTTAVADTGGVLLQRGNTVYSLSDSDRAYETTDGDTWTEFTIPVTSTVEAGTYSPFEDCFYVRAGNSIYKTNAGGRPTQFTWLSNWSGGYNMTYVHAGDDNYVFIDSDSGYYGRIRNGGNLERLTIPNNSSWVQLAFANGILLHSKDSVTCTSTDYGETWSRHTGAISTNGNDVRAVKGVNDSFYAGYVNSNTIYVSKSTDGINWTEFEVGNGNSISRGGIEFSSAGLIIAGGDSFGFYWSSLSTTELEFADNTNFEDFGINETYNESAGTKSAQVLSKNATTSTMVVSTEDTFVANADEKLVSHTEVTDANPDADTLIFTATPYQDTPDGETTPGTATWDVATSADFSTGLMTDTTAVVRDVNNSLEPSERVNISLEADTEYYTRVTYTNNDGSLSAVSATHHFRTAEEESTTGQPPENWISNTAAQDNSWQSITYGNGYFVAISNDGNKRLMYAEDPSGRWYSVATPQANNWQRITYGNGYFVAVSGDGSNRIIWATDPTDAGNWTAVQIPGDNLTLLDVTFADGKFLAISNSNAIYATDPRATENWAVTNDFTVTGMNRVTYGDGHYVAVGNGTAGNRTTFAAHAEGPWTGKAASSQSSWTRCTYGNGYFVATASNPNRVMYTSSVNEPWAQYDLTAATTSIKSVYYANGIYTILTRDEVFWATDPTAPGNWTSTPTPESNVWQDHVYGDGYYVAVSSGGTNRIMYSSTGELFYNEINNTATNYVQLARNYGVAGTSPELGIYELTEQPTYAVDTYVKRGDKYHPIRDYTSELEETQTALEQANTTIETLQTRLTGIEADEIVDDATDDTLLTSLASLLERVEALENG